MDVQDTVKLTLYVGAWSWHIIGVIFLAISVIFLSMKEYGYFLAYMLIFLFCEIIARRRQREFEDEQT